MVKINVTKKMYNSLRENGSLKLRYEKRDRYYDIFFRGGEREYINYAVYIEAHWEYQACAIARAFWVQKQSEYTLKSATNRTSFNQFREAVEEVCRELDKYDKYQKICYDEEMRHDK